MNNKKNTHTIELIHQATTDARSKSVAKYWCWWRWNTIL